MKKAIILFLTFSVFNFSFGQDNNVNKNPKSSTPKADKYFRQMWYKEAAEVYERELKSINKEKEKSEHIRLLKAAGNSYFFNTDMKNAYKFYNTLVSDYYSSTEPEYLFRYAHSLEGVGRYKEAKLWMQEFSRKLEKTKDNRVIEYSQKTKTIENILDIEPNFILHNLSINTKYSDFGAMYYEDKLVYSSAVDTSYYHTRTYHWNEQPFLNMYVGKLNEIESDLITTENFSRNLNTIYHEATLAFSLDRKRVYFTRNNFNGDLGRDANGTNHLKLYTAELITNEDGESSWENVKELPFNSENYSVGHPTISKDGKLLYFVSDMPGSLGATDIFVVDILQSKNGEINYSKPRNLGSTINTPGREMFPFITDKALYFSSDSHLGLGGLDVFKSNLVKEDNSVSFKTPINLGAPLNSELDDFSFIIKEDENKGFVSSNRTTGKGDDDIYSFVRLKEESVKRTKKPVVENTPEETICKQLVTGNISNNITGEKISDVMVTLYNESGKVIETSSTNFNGTYTFKTVLNCNTKFKVEASKQGYAKKDKDFLTEKVNGETKVNLGLETVNKLIVEERGVLKIKIEIIHFDLNKSFIRKDAAIELNKIVSVMKQFPSMVIKIESHTDSRASDLYNLKLSDRRAKSTRKYIISKGIEPNRITSAMGYGEKRLLNKCSNGVRCSEEEHQKNRRSEFIIIKM